MEFDKKPTFGPSSSYLKKNCVPIQSKVKTTFVIVFILFAALSANQILFRKVFVNKSILLLPLRSLFQTEHIK